VSVVFYLFTLFQGDIMQVQPYLYFSGRCDEAIEFYKSVLGAKVDMLMRFNESPQPHPEGAVPPGFEKKVMHASLRIGNSVVMCSDGCSQTLASFVGFGLSLSVSTDAEAEKYFAALSNGGQVRMPMAKTFFSSRFGMVADKFGVAWMVIVQA
jgi:PhnB protein